LLECRAGKVVETPQLFAPYRRMRHHQRSTTSQSVVRVEVRGGFVRICVDLLHFRLCWIKSIGYKITGTNVYKIGQNSRKIHNLLHAKFGTQHGLVVPIIYSVELIIFK